MIRNAAAGLVGTLVVAGTGTARDTAATAAEIGTKDNPVAVIGAGGAWRWRAA